MNINEGDKVRVRDGNGTVYTIGENIVTGHGFVTGYVYRQGELVIRRVMHVDNLEMVK